MIRPSALKIGRYCTLAPLLSEKYPDRSDAAFYGQEVDRIVGLILQGHAGVFHNLDAVADAEACSAQLETLRMSGWTIEYQKAVTLYDPDTGGVMTRGTPDIIATRGDELMIIDLKKREQYWAGRLDDIDPDLQTHAYALGAVSLYSTKRYRKAFMLFGDGKADVQMSRWYEEAEWPALIEEIRNIELRDVKPTRGTHCLSCYPRQHCPAWLIPEGEGIETALEPFTRPGGLTVDNAGQALELYKRAEDLMDKVGEQLKDFARKNGGITVGERKWAPILMPGRESANVSALKAAGLTEYVRQGGSFEQFRWLRAGKNG